MSQRPGKPKRARLLVVDDDPASATLIRDCFAGRDYEIYDARDGETGLTLAADRNPDIILLDLRMPGLDGISVARQLKTDPRTRIVPVIVLTACRDVDAKVEAFSAGADDYITKPFQVEEIEARVQAMLRKREFLAGLELTIRDLASTNQQLEQLLMLDDKTGLYNFREFQRRLREEWARAERYQQPLSLVFFDLDRFKQVNDGLGHQAGDRVLQEFATLVTGGARGSDVAARYGGEEFAVILPHTDGEMAYRVADRIRRAVRDFVFLEDETGTRVTVSAGVATYPGIAAVDSMDALVRCADQALYLAKDLGRDRVIRFGETPATGRRPEGPEHEKPRTHDRKPADSPSTS